MHVQVTAATRGSPGLQTISQKCSMHACWWNVFDDMCWSFWSWFDVNRLLRFHSQRSWPLTFRSQIRSTSYSCPVLYFDQAGSF